VSTYDWYAARLDRTPKVYTRSGPFGTEALKTVAEALAFCERNGLDPTRVRLAHNHVIWEAEETPEEVQARVERARLDRAEHLARIREIYDGYVERGLYGDDR
jgi:hypothetical protein